ncbi:MAG: 30S ribosomal protein S20 [Hyphomicrobiaceae bacterium]
MANTPSAKKAARQTLRRTEVNKTRRTRLRTVVRNVEEAIASGNKGAAREALRQAEPVLARSGQLGVVHTNAASRKVSRLSHQIRAMAE